ncbi:hypothetical protein BDK51DRAFT_28585 [Blyttiomyces helicus]|uniref:Uncharacterized protein n=1 Tax=Blyttiomyces helicus TaxID=388810 RepID=A0A4P9WL67_9FUNG|nr:hypothetical protein BDK51DRAFT_28585 [Blyttiomyces helicus]|eukprot:RKO92803.1 hypothetical protein BDK51DRAFT_28585 [Blyttiomyces helicus]
MATKSLSLTTVPLHLEITLTRPAPVASISTSLAKFLRSPAAGQLPTDVVHQLGEMDRALQWQQEARVDARRAKGAWPGRAVKGIQKKGAAGAEAGAKTLDIPGVMAEGGGKVEKVKVPKAKKKGSKWA